MTEFELIEKLARRYGASSLYDTDSCDTDGGDFADAGDSFDTPGVGRSGVKVGIGDDCAVLERGSFDLVTTDTLVENVHFSMSYMTPEQVGFKTLAASLSDIAAMGGVPGAYFVNISLPKRYDADFVERLYAGMAQAADKLLPEGVRVSLAGGDMTRSLGPLVLTLTLLGTSPVRSTTSGDSMPPTGALLRCGAKVGDSVYVTGTLGDSAAGLELLSQSPSLPQLDELRDSDDEGKQFYAQLAERHARPTARVGFGAALGLSGLATAMIDCSDGLLQDLGHLVSASGVGAQVLAPTMPRSKALEYFGQQTGEDIEALMATGGEDFELIFTAPKTADGALFALAKELNVPLTAIGIVTQGEGVELLDEAGEAKTFERQGYQHW